MIDRTDRDAAQALAGATADHHDDPDVSEPGAGARDRAQRETGALGDLGVGGLAIPVRVSATRASALRYVWTNWGASRSSPTRRETRRGRRRCARAAHGS